MKDTRDETHLTRREATKGKCACLGIYLRNDLTDEEQKERQDDRLREEAKYGRRREVEDQSEGIARKDDDSDIDEVITYEDRRQQSL